MVTLDKITIIVSSVRHIDVEILVGPKRNSHYSESRHLFSLIAREQGYDLKSIAQKLHKDHSSICHGINRAGELIEIDRNYKVDYETIKELINAERLSN